MLCITRNGSVYIFKKSRDKKPDDDDEDKVPERLWRVQSVINDIHNSILERSNEKLVNVEFYERYKLQDFTKLFTDNHTLL